MSEQIESSDTQSWDTDKRIGNGAVCWYSYFACTLAVLSLSSKIGSKI
jgi:hypothetical protein